MKAITIIQPWATLIAILKRAMRLATGLQHRGPIAIHAGKKIDREACEVPEIKARLVRHGYSVDNLPTGAVVAIANLTECWSIGTDYQSGMPPLYNGTGGQDKRVSLKEDKFGFTPGRYAWEMSDVKCLAEPIPEKGMQGLWNWEGMSA